MLRGPEVWVTDFGSTNGTFVNGERVEAPTLVPVGAILQVRRQLLKYEWRSWRERTHSTELGRDLETANAYVQALPPARISDGPIRADWLFQPSAKLGCDAVGYGMLPDGRFASYLMDVSGHGAGAAMQNVAAMNVLRRRALPGADVAAPPKCWAP